MPQADTFQAVFELEQALGASWRNIHAAHEKSVKLHERLTSEVAQLTGEDSAIVVFGSLGRFEVTSESDIDWTHLIDGQADLRHQMTAHQIGQRISSVRNKKPGREGVFGAVAFSHDLLQYIGGQDDTNDNLTRRILLLLESKPIGRRDAYDRVIRVVLERYLTGDYGWINGRTLYGVPRFLSNDIARYWRTVAVDFAYKQWTRDNAGWALRSAKLRMSRKLTYAAGLLYCFSLAGALPEAVMPKDSTYKQQAIETLWSLSNSTPLDLIARAFAGTPSLAKSAESAFAAYDSFLGLLENGEEREHLEELASEDADDDALYQRVRGLGRQFQDALTALFFNEDAKFAPLTVEYGVF